MPQLNTLASSKTITNNDSSKAVSEADAKHSSLNNDMQSRQGTNFEQNESNKFQQELGSDCYAAVDLGSNSFHLVISRYQHGEFSVLDRQRESVRLAGGLDERNHLDEEVAMRALACLKQFGQLLRALPAENVRAVGTNALRRLQNKTAFLDRAEQALGHNIEIIAGREEARLIYLGAVSYTHLTLPTILLV